ncbi:MAG: prolipoprotein diacylglyceryl transferase [Pseudomonadota bacterium]
MLSFAAAGVLSYPDIGPFLFEINGYGLRYYSLAYIIGLGLGWWYMRRLITRPGSAMSEAHVDDFLMWATLGTIIGGRLGSALFYNLESTLADPISIFMVWKGGMSFHGGLIGVTAGIILFALKNRLSPPGVGDLAAATVPIGLFFGRIANFINGELYGHPADVPWAMVFPSDPLQVPRHPSQLYEAFLEGLVLFFILRWVYMQTLAGRWHGFTAGAFLVCYGAFRFLIEFVRKPDDHIGVLSTGLTMGQTLSLPMILIGIAFIQYARKTQKTGVPYRVRKKQDRD